MFKPPYSKDKDNIRRIVSCLLLMALLLFTLAHAQTPETPISPALTTPPNKQVIRFVFGGSPPGTYLYRLAELVYSEAFARLGYGFELYALPLERALLEVDAGRMDGEVARIEFDNALAAQYPNMIQVPEPVSQIPWAAFSTDRRLHFSGWEALGRGKLRVGCPRGYKLAETALQGHVTPQLLFAMTDIDQGLTMLQHGRIDVLVAVAPIVESILKQSRFKDAGIFQAGILEKTPTYPYLNQKHRDLVAPLAAALKAMKADGTWARLEAQAKSAQATPLPTP
ncbi:MAG: transporter substrate-binding domain-containing protein [Desulfobacteraceae bacterium]|nr:transporter substrate-binding domain-containing protein [Desulfobacteraceae bacterium]